MMYRIALTSILQHHHEGRISEPILAILRNCDKKEIFRRIGTTVSCVYTEQITGKTSAKLRQHHHLMYTQIRLNNLLKNVLTIT